MASWTRRVESAFDLRIDSIPGGNVVVGILVIPFIPVLFSACFFLDALERYGMNRFRRNAYWAIMQTRGCVLLEKWFPGDHFEQDGDRNLIVDMLRAGRWYRLSQNLPEPETLAYLSDVLSGPAVFYKGVIYVRDEGDFILMKITTAK